MRLLPAVLLALALAGCDTFLAEPGPRVGEAAPGGQGIVVGHGQIDGAEFLATATRQGNDVCVSLRFAGIPHRLGHTCTQVMVGGQATNSLGFSSGTGSPTIAEGFVSMNAVRVQVTTSDGVFDAPTASLMALGVPGNAFSLVEETIRPPLVSLEPLGFRGSGFALVLFNRADFIDAHGYDARGRVVRQADPPAIPAPH